MHTLSLRTFGLAALGAFSAFGLSAAAVAEDSFPTRPITMVVPFPPGGGGDAQGRLLALKLGEKLGQSVVIDNRPGAGTAIGAAFVANAKPDGYTLLMSSASTYTLNPAIRKSLPYDPIKRFEPIGIVSRVGLVMLANPAVPVNNVKELAAAAKAAPDKYAYASFGSGTSSHFAAEMALQAIGVKLMHVPYKGSGPAMTDLIGGQVPFSFDTVTAALPQIKAGKVKAIAITTMNRSPLLPAVPTFAESGYPAAVLDSWGMVVAPRGLPPAVHAKLEKALAETIADPAVRKGFADQGVEARFVDSAKAAAHLEAELPLMRAIAVRANIQPE
ncbi:Bug family tripartite tricarboxylate transporter substrate binding protein [Variovorax saccharolyticus]|uniref:Bug family tripartite tricarboxylate transporter substrate binding protein n=1 Tax=Variovorax saccharolyticus TaxID=3053516 RepID=UPI0025774F7F|nr:tripartite tricarboxylate transporter substrate binding protein [Variovorax sp. J22R187]MDM0022081.1 tripartite tricarboxylate transporter substrate binding protein [Variovorax sp. J22R187]